MVMHPNDGTNNPGPGGGGGGGPTTLETPAEGATSAESPQQRFCLRWNNHQTNLINVFDQLLQNGWFVDVTLACDGRSVQAHKVVLSACSPYFQALFTDNPCQHPIVILKDISYSDLKSVVEFMYKGEINVAQEQIGPLLRVAETLKIRGLAEINNEPELKSSTTDVRAGTPGSQPRKRRRRSVERSPENHADKRACPPSPGQGSGSAGQAPPGHPGMAPGAVDRQPPAQGPPQQSQQQGTPGQRDVIDDLDIKPGIAEMIREEERAKKLESSQAWLCASTSSGPVADADTPLALTKDDSTAVESALDLACSPPLGSSPGGSGGPALKLKAPTWSQGQLQEAIQAVVTQQLRFTTAAARYGIPKGTLYDNILGKTKRMMILEKLALTPEEEVHILEFCCEISLSPYNRRTRKSLAEVLAFVTELRRRRDPSFAFEGLSGFRWWWAFCKKHCIVSLYFDSRCPPGSQGSPGPSEIDENNAEGLLGPTAGGGPPRKLYFDLEPLAINYSTKKKREDRVVFADSQIETKANSEMYAAGYFKLD